MSLLRNIFRFSNAVRIASICAIIALIIAYANPFIHPKNLWILPFFGLAYPIIIGFTLLLMVYWSIFKRWKWVILLGILLLIGFKFTLRLYAFGPEEVMENPTSTITIHSNNVRIFDLYNEDKEEKFKTRDSIFNYALEQNPDVVCFQEFYNKDNPTKFQTEDLFFKQFKAVDFHQRYIYKKVGRQHFGVVMYSRLPVIAKGDVIYEIEDQINYNFCIYMDVVKDKDTFRVYNAHLQSFRISQLVEDSSFMANRKTILEKLSTAYPKRADQALRIMEHINNCPYPVVVCGDFNDTPVSFVYNTFSNSLSDAFLTSGKGIGSTYVGKLPAGRIDYFFHNPQLVANNFILQQNPFSDHRAITCTFNKYANHE